MESIQISSLGAAYQYASKIKQKFKKNNNWDFSYANPSQQKHNKGGLNLERK
jgi:hypothetical protein